MNIYEKKRLNKLSLFSLCRIFCYNFSTYSDIYNNVNGNHLIILYLLETFFKDKFKQCYNYNNIYEEKLIWDCGLKVGFHFEPLVGFDRLNFIP